MKKVLLGLIVFAFYSCSSGLSKDEKEFLEFQIGTHNIVAKSKYYDAFYTTGVTYYKWNDPYDILKDTALTLEKYLDYCDNFDHDPKTYINFIK